MYQFLSHAEHYDPKYQALGYFGPEWWFLLHMTQTPMVGLVAVGLWLMVDDVSGDAGGATIACAWLARVAIFVFAVYFTVLDAIGGVRRCPADRPAREPQAPPASPRAPPP